MRKHVTYGVRWRKQTYKQSPHLPLHWPARWIKSPVPIVAWAGDGNLQASNSVELWASKQPSVETVTFELCAKTDRGNIR